MKVFTLHSPPATPGLYTIRNRATGQFYIGKAMNIRQRYADWKTSFGCGLGLKNLRVKEAIEATNLDDWEFVVTAEFPGIEDAELRKHEAAEITKALEASKDLLLNGVYPTQPRRAGTQTSPSSIIYDDTDTPISYSAAARVLGCTIQTLQKRLANRRSKGEFEHRLSELRQGSRLYRAMVEGREPQLPNN